MSISDTLSLAVRRVPQLPNQNNKRTVNSQEKKREEKKETHTCSVTVICTSLQQSRHTVWGVIQCDNWEVDVCPCTGITYEL